MINSRLKLEVEGLCNFGVCRIFVEEVLELRFVDKRFVRRDIFIIRIDNHNGIWRWPAILFSVWTFRSRLLCFRFEPSSAPPYYSQASFVAVYEYCSALGRKNWVGMDGVNATRQVITTPNMLVTGRQLEMKTWTETYVYWVFWTVRRTRAVVDGAIFVVLGSQTTLGIVIGDAIVVRQVFSCNGRRSCHHFYACDN